MSSLAADSQHDFMPPSIHDKYDEYPYKVLAMTFHVLRVSAPKDCVLIVTRTERRARQGIAQ
jgi:hypothetical protein